MSRRRKPNTSRRHAASRRAFHEGVRRSAAAEMEVVRARQGFLMIEERGEILKAKHAEMVEQMGSPSPRPARLG